MRRIAGNHAVGNTHGIAAVAGRAGSDEQLGNIGIGFEEAGKGSASGLFSASFTTCDGFHPL